MNIVPVSEMAVQIHRGQHRQMFLGLDTLEQQISSLEFILWSFRTRERRRKQHSLNSAKKIPQICTMLEGLSHEGIHEELCIWVSCLFFI